MPILPAKPEPLKQKLKIFYKSEALILAGILILYLSLRIISWTQVTTLDDHDSVGYLQTAKIIENHQWSKLNPMDTFFYPVLIVFFRQDNISYENSARLVSLLLSIILFFTVYTWGKKITSSKGVFLVLLLLALNPFLINLSIAALSEPSYIALVYLGLFLFSYSIKRNNISLAIICGLIFGLSFSDRTEGIIFILFIPIMKLFYYLFWEKKNYSFSYLVKWILLFIFGFSIITVPVIIYVSTQMGTLAINGRTAWQKLLSSSDLKSYEEKLQGLDFSASEVNLKYVLSHPDALEKKQEKIKSNNYSNKNTTHINFDTIKYFILDVTRLYRSSLSSIVGAFILVFCGIGLYYLFIKQKHKDLLLIIFFTAAVLIPPMMLFGYRERHIAIIIPALIIVAGIGLNELCNGIVSAIKNKKIQFLFRNKIGIIFIILMIFFSLGWLNDALRHPSPNKEYSLINYEKPLFILKEDIRKSEIKDPKISSRKAYFPYYADVDQFALPYTNYDSLVNYFRLNDGNYLFLEYKFIEDYPYLKRFQEKDVPDFKLLYSGYDDKGNKIELYRFIKNFQ